MPVPVPNERMVDYAWHLRIQMGLTWRQAAERLAEDWDLRDGEGRPKVPCTATMRSYVKQAEDRQVFEPLTTEHLLARQEHLWTLCYEAYQNGGMTKEQGTAFDFMWRMYQHMLVAGRAFPVPLDKPGVSPDIQKIIREMAAKENGHWR